MFVEVTEGGKYPGRSNISVDLLVSQAKVWNCRYSSGTSISNPLKASMGDIHDAKRFHEKIMPGVKPLGQEGSIMDGREGQRHQNHKSIEMEVGWIFDER